MTTTTSQLKSVLDATVDALTLNPGAGAKQFDASSELVGTCLVSVRMGDHTTTVDQPEGLGDGLAANPVELALASLGSCQAMTYRFWSEKLGVQLDEVRVEVRGDLDVRRIFGVDDAVRPGFGNVEIEVHLSGPEAPARYAALRQAVDDHCPMLDVFANAVPVRTSLQVA